MDNETARKRIRVWKRERERESLGWQICALAGRQTLEFGQLATCRLGLPGFSP